MAEDSESLLSGSTSLRSGSDKAWWRRPAVLAFGSPALVALAWVALVHVKGGRQVRPELLVQSLQGETVELDESILGKTSWPEGIELRAVHVQRLDESKLVHVRHPVRQLLQTDTGRTSGPTSQRDLVRLMMELSVLAYEHNHEYPQTVMQPILAAGESVYGPNVKTYEEEVAHRKSIMSQIREALLSQGNITERLALGINASAQNSIGVHAYEFSKPGFATVLVFRGTYTAADEDNAVDWIGRWAKLRGDYQLRHQWIDQAGLSWAEVDKGIHTTFGGTADDMSFLMGAWGRTQKFVERLKNLGRSVGMNAASVQKLSKTGYWEFTKLIADSAVASWRQEEDKHRGEKFMITGHSQGGSRAALTSMYLEKRTGIQHTTLTFGSIGASCFARDLTFSHGDLLQDVDPYVVHPQITEYAHVLDVYGNFDYDPGKVCLYGVSDLRNMPAYKYCRKVYDYKPSTLFVSAMVTLPWMGEVNNNFERCNYFTHERQRMRLDLANPAYLREDGTTDGHCKQGLEIPAHDPKGLCPAESVAVGAVDCEDLETAGTCAAARHVIPGVAPCKWCRGVCIGSTTFQAIFSCR